MIQFGVGVCLPENVDDYAIHTSIIFFVQKEQ